jgi:hypothetical protein
LTREGAKDGLAKVTVNATSISVVAGGDGQYSFVARIAVVVHALVAVTCCEKHYAAHTASTLRDGIVDR